MGTTDRMTTPSATARELAAKLVDRENRSGDKAATSASAAAFAGDDLYRALSRWIGRDGCHALFARARAQEQPANQALDALKLNPRHEPYITGVDDSIGEYGDGATADAIESMIVGMIELLGRLIGVDMATSLIERSLAEVAHDNSGPEKRRAKA
jgi:hypothetical protein